MYDTRERARRDRQSALNDSFRKGKAEGKVEGLAVLIRTLQDLLNVPLTDERQLRALAPEALQAIAADLRKRLRERQGS